MLKRKVEKAEKQNQEGEKITDDGGQDGLPSNGFIPTPPFVGSQTNGRSHLHLGGADSKWEEFLISKALLKL